MVAPGRGLAEELQQERLRLANRIRQQLWRYYPQLLELGEDVTTEWILALWSVAPTPAKAAQLREATVARLLARHRIRRLDAASVLDTLRQPAITVAAGVTEAAVLHLRSLVARLRQALFHWARVAIVHDPKSRSRYEALRARGHSYGRALRGVADRLLGVACALLRQQVLFDPDHAKPAAA